MENLPVPNSAAAIQIWLEVIKAVQDDAEKAHSMEDSLRAGVLMAIAEGKSEDPAVCARMALKTDEIEFERWCA